MPIARYLASLSGVALLLILLPSITLAATTPDVAADSGLQEILVTATRREEKLQDVPISVSVFSQEKLDKQGIRNVDDLTRLTPGVTFTRNGVAGNYNDESSDINIRGIDSTGGASTVGIYIDDTPIQNRRIGFGTLNAFPMLFDLDRVEILRGPQGTLFGAGSEGGTVRFITPEPGLTQDKAYLLSELSTTRNGDPSEQYGAAFGGPIINNVLGFRVSASFRHDGGYVDRVDYRNLQTLEPRSNWQQAVNFRAELKWQPIEALTISPSFYYQELHVNDTSAYWPGLSYPSSTVFRNGNAQSNPSTDPFYLVALKAAWDVGYVQLSSHTSFYSRNQHSVSDYTQFDRALYWASGDLATYLPAASDRVSSYFTDTQNNIYQEFRAVSNGTDNFSWSSGLFFAHLNENSTENIYDPTLNGEVKTFTGRAGTCEPADTACNSSGLIYYQPFYKVVDQEAALFGEATYRFANVLKATAGVRVSHQSSAGKSLYGGALSGVPTPAVSDQATSENPVTPKGVLSYQPNTESLFYASAAKGFRIGGTNVDVGPICGKDAGNLGLPIGTNGQRHTPTSYGSDNLWSYELGAKNTFLNHRMQINWSLFLINWKNIQQTIYLPNCGLQYVANLGEARSEGGDLNIIYRPLPDLLLDFTAAYTDARYTKYSCASSLNYSDGTCNNGAGGTTAIPIVSKGDRLPGAPWSFLAAVEYTFNFISGDGKPYIRMDYQYTTALHALTPMNNGADGGDSTIPSLALSRNLQLRAGVRWNVLDISVFGQNLTNEHPITAESRDIYIPGENLYFEHTMRPRQFGVTATYRY